MFKNIKKDFPIFNKKVNGCNIIYFDNAATTFKPKIVIKEIVKYYSEYTSNVYRSDFLFGTKTTLKLEEAKENIGKYIGTSKNNLVFTSGSTNSSNIVAQSLISVLKKNDEIIINAAEHSSNLLVWYNLAKTTGAKIIYAPLEKDLSLKFSSLKKVITSKTKIIAYALTTNVVGDTRDVTKISEYAHTKNIITVIDAAQGILYNKINVSKIKCDFLYFGAHKIFGPTGSGVLYVSKKWHQIMKPLNYGGGMVDLISQNNNFILKSFPYKLEGGTPNIAGIIGFGAAIKFLNNWTQNQIKKYLFDLKCYAVKKMKTIPQIEIYNAHVEGVIIMWNFKNVFSQDVARYLAKRGIAVRCGDHCAKLLKINNKINNTIRISFTIYNNKKEVDHFVELLKNKSLKTFTSDYFQDVSGVNDGL